MIAFCLVPVERRVLYVTQGTFKVSTDEEQDIKNRF